METEIINEKPLINPEAVSEQIIVESEPVFGIPRKKRKLVRTTIQFKKEIIEKFESGVRVSELSSEYCMARSTISTILKNREVIKAADVAKGVKSVSKQRPRVLEEVEKLLLIWVNQKQIDGEPITEPIISEKAKKLFADLVEKKQEPSEGESFKASRGWYENFKKRSGICKHEEAASARKKSAEKFMNDFREYVNEERFYPQQIFSCNDTGLFWKKLPRRTFLTQEEMATPGHRPMNDRATLLLCSNASGDLKLKPLLVYHSENPRAFHKNHVSKAELPVLWRSHPKGWITKQIFSEWMNEVLGPTVREYLLEKGLPLKALLLLDNTPAHPVDLEDSLHDEFNFLTVRFIPSDATPLLRPLDQDVLSNFKKLYLKVLLQRCNSVTSNTELTLREFWKSHLNIFHCIQLIEKAWEEVSSCRLNSAWKNLWPEGVFKTEYEILGTESTKITEDILNLSLGLGLQVDENDIEELLLEVKKELTTEELQELLKEQERLISVEMSAGLDETKEEFSVSALKDVLTKWEAVQNFVGQYHPDRGSTDRVVGQMNDQVFSYFRRMLSIKGKTKKYNSFCS